MIGGSWGVGLGSSPHACQSMSNNTPGRVAVHWSSYGTGRAPHVRLPGVRAGLTAAARLLFAAERAGYFGFRGAGIDIGDTAIRAVGGEEAFGFLDVERKDRGLEAGGSVPR